MAGENYLTAKDIAEMLYIPTDAIPSVKIALVYDHNGQMHVVNLNRMFGEVCVKINSGGMKNDF